MVVAAGRATEVVTGSGAEAALPPTPGFVVRSESWVPSAIGPLGLAGQEPRGLRGLLWPNGIVPEAPTATFPTKTF